jgi:hypothetical protein
MGFIIRSVFWLSLVLMLIPVEGSGNADHPAVSPFQAIIAARDAVADVGGMCDRKPEVCVTGRAALDTLGMRARETARFAYGLMDERDAPAEASETAEQQAAVPDTTISTGTVR